MNLMKATEVVGNVNARVSGQHGINPVVPGVHENIILKGSTQWLEAAGLWKYMAFQWAPGTKW